MIDRQMMGSLPIDAARAVSVLVCGSPAAARKMVLEEQAMEYRLGEQPANSCPNRRLQPETWTRALLRQLKSLICCVSSSAF